MRTPFSIHRTSCGDVLPAALATAQIKAHEMKDAPVMPIFLKIRDIPKTFPHSLIREVKKKKHFAADQILLYGVRPQQGITTWLVWKT